jgi:hypothetical protein
MEKRNYNMEALRGLDVDDKDYVETFGLPMYVAYTPKLNDVLLDKVHKENVQFFLEQGDSEPDAKRKADEARKGAQESLMKLYAENGLL